MSLSAAASCTLSLGHRHTKLSSFVLGNEGRHYAARFEAAAAASLGTTSAVQLCKSQFCRRLGRVPSSTRAIAAMKAGRCHVKESNSRSVANREMPLSGSRPQGLEFKALLTELRP